MINKYIYSFISKLTQTSKTCVYKFRESRLKIRLLKVITKISANYRWVTCSYNGLVGTRTLQTVDRAVPIFQKISKLQKWATIRWSTLTSENFLNYNNKKYSNRPDSLENRVVGVVLLVPVFSFGDSCLKRSPKIFSFEFEILKSRFSVSLFRSKFEALSRIWSREFSISTVDIFCKKSVESDSVSEKIRGIGPCVSGLFSESRLFSKDSIRNSAWVKTSSTKSSICAASGDRGVIWCPSVFSDRSFSDEVSDSMPLLFLGSKKNSQKTFIT